MSSPPPDPERDAPADDDNDPDWVDRLSSERRRRAREWEEAFGGAKQLAPDGGADSDAAPRRPGSPAKNKDTSFFDQDEPEPRPRRRRRPAARPKDLGFYDQDEEPVS